MTKMGQRYSEKSETAMLVLFLVTSLVIFFAVVAAQGHQPDRCSPLTVRESAAPLDLDDLYPETHREGAAWAEPRPEVAVPGPTIKPEFQIRLI